MRNEVTEKEYIELESYCLKEMEKVLGLERLVKSQKATIAEQDKLITVLEEKISLLEARDAK